MRISSSFVKNAITSVKVFKAEKEGEVESGAEGLARAGDDQSLDLVVFVNIFNDFVQCLQGFPGNGIRYTVIECCNNDVVLNSFFEHGRPPVAYLCVVFIYFLSTMAVLDKEKMQKYVIFYTCTKE